jgi:hypothetical protein
MRYEDALSLINHIVNMVNSGEWSCFRLRCAGRRGFIPFLSMFRLWAWYTETEYGPCLMLMWRGEDELYPVSMSQSSDTKEYLEYPPGFEDSSSSFWLDDDEGSEIQFLLPAQYVDVEL